MESKARTFCAMARATAEAEVGEYKRKKEEKEAFLERVVKELPEGLEAHFTGLERVVEFWEKVKKLPSDKLDDHILYGCGRDRRRKHLTEVSGDDGFFYGADPNDVARYVADFRQGKKSAKKGRCVTPPAVASASASASVGEGMSAMAPAFANARRG